MLVVSVQDFNEMWVVEQVISLLDQARNNEAQSLAQEWGFDWDDFEGGATP